MHCYNCGANVVGEGYNFCSSCGIKITKDKDVSGIPSDIVELILTDTEALQQFKEQDSFMGYTKEVILEAIETYLTNDLNMMDSYNMKINISEYADYIKKVFPIPNAITSSNIFKTIKQISSKDMHSNSLIDDCLMEAFIDIELDENYNLEELLQELNNNDYTNYSKISHLVALGHPKFKTQEAFEYVFRGIIDFDLKPENYDIIIRNFAAEVAKKSNLKHCRVFLENKSTSLGSYLPTGIERFGLNEEIPKAIFLNFDYLSPDNIIDNIQTIFHEVRHGVQVTAPKLNNYETLQIVKDSFLENKYGKEYYDENYWYFSAEVDAERTSMYQTTLFMETFTTKGRGLCEERFRERLKKLKDGTLRLLSGESEEIWASMDTLFNKYSKEALENPKLRPILLQEYKENGKRKLISELLSDRNQDNQELTHSLIFEHTHSMDEIDENLTDLYAINYEKDSISRTDGFDIVKKLLNDIEDNLYIDEINKKEIDKDRLEALIAKAQMLLEKVVGGKVDVNIRNMFIDRLEPTLENIEEQTGYGKR